MRKINIGIIGTIGSGKTTFMENLNKELSKDFKVLVEPEPSVTIPFINEVLKKFYEDNKAWSYPLQLTISSAQEAYMQTLRESDYDFSLFDAPYSSDIYSYSHAKHGRMKIEDHYALVSVGRPFKFHYIILINPGKDTTIKHIKKRNKSIKSNELTEEKKDVSIEDFSYLDEHIEDFMEYMPIYLNKFRSFYSRTKIIELKEVPDVETEEFKLLLRKIVGEVKNIEN